MEGQPGADVQGPMEVGLCLKCSRCCIMAVRWVGSWGLPGTSKVHSKIQVTARQPSVQCTFKNACRKACDSFMRSRINFHPTRSKYRTVPAPQRAR